MELDRFHEFEFEKAPYRTRAVEEFREVLKRKDALGRELESIESFYDPEERKMLREQFMIMWLYCNVLVRRMRHWDDMRKSDGE